MRDLVALYRQQFKTTLAMMLQYRAALLIWMIGHVLEPLVYLVVWTAVARGSGGSIGGYDAAGFASYFIVLMLVNHLTFTWIMYEYDYRIREGILSAALLRPVHPVHADIADNVASKLVNLPFMIVIAIILGLVFHAVISPAWWAVLIFIPVIFLAFLVRFLLEWTLALTAFWTTRTSAVNQAYFFLMLFLSGQLAPLEIMPRAVQIVAWVLPFRWLVGFPVELILGRLNLTEALAGLGMQCFWLIASLALMRFVWRVGVKMYTAVGA